MRNACLYAPALLLALAACDPRPGLETANTELKARFGALSALFEPTPPPPKPGNAMAEIAGEMETGGERFTGRLIQRPEGDGDVGLALSGGTNCVGAFQRRADRELSGPLHCDDGRTGSLIIDPKNMMQPGRGEIGERAIRFRLHRPAKGGDPNAPLLH